MLWCCVCCWRHQIGAGGTRKAWADAIDPSGFVSSRFQIIRFASEIRRLRCVHKTRGNNVIASSLDVTLLKNRKVDKNIVRRPITKAILPILSIPPPLYRLCGSTSSPLGVYLQAGSVECNQWIVCFIKPFPRSFPLQRPVVLCNNFFFQQKLTLLVQGRCYAFPNNMKLKKCFINRVATCVTQKRK